MSGEGSRQRYEDYRRRRRDPAEQATRAKSQRQRSLPRLLLELTRVLGGDWTVVILGVSLGTASTLLKLAPAASTKLAIDHVLLGQTLPTWLPAWVPVPAEPGGRLLLLVAAVMSTILVGSLLSLAGRWLVTRTSKRVQERMRRRVFAGFRSIASTSSGPGGPARFCATTPAGSASSSSRCFSTPGGRWCNSSAGS